MTRQTSKTCAWLMSILLAGGLMGCGQQAAAVDSTVESSTIQESTQEEGSTQEAESVASDALTAIEVAKQMGNGINLGNTMEAYGHMDPGVGQDTQVYETLWGQPVTTKEMVAGMKASGFDSIRVPVAWTNAMNFESGDYTIGADYLDRVEEIVNYAIDADMYVIINDHWDGSWWGMFGSATEETRTEAMELYTTMWTQIAERFADYPEQLIFESGNEELGSRLNDVDVCKDSGALSEDECYETTNLINQTFVDTIRKSGGNNAERFLLIAGYDTNIAKTSDDRFQMPTDTAENKLLVSVHYYDPWTFCGTDSVTMWGSEKEYQAMNEAFAKLTKFTEQGYGVVIGEYGALTMSDGTYKESTVVYTENLLNNCDLYGYCPMLWDTNAFYKRESMKIEQEELAALYAGRNVAEQAKLTEEEIQENAKKAMDEDLEASKSYDNSSEFVVTGDEGAVAWIMYQSADCQLAYSVGDTYDPTSKSKGIEVVDAKIEGEGTYTVSIDFTGTEQGYANGVMFSALGLYNGELLYPGYVIDITEFLVNGEPYAMNGTPYTSSDDKKCTRVNLYNGWVGSVPEDARCADGDLSAASPTLLNSDTLGNVESISITFEYKAVE